MRRFLLAALLALAAAFPADAQTYYDIDVDLPSYPEMEPIPDSPVYYAPAVDSNYFFYDGLYWDYTNDAWYSSPWYNGPWAYVEPVYVPTYVLWVPIRYYRRPPHHFRAWNPAGPPRWGQHWGPEWQRRHNAHFAGHRAPVQRAPLPVYQRQFPRERYPRAVEQNALHLQNYRYVPRDASVRQHYERRGIAPGAQPNGRGNDGRDGRGHEGRGGDGRDGRGDRDGRR